MTVEKPNSYEDRSVLCVVRSAYLTPGVFRETGVGTEGNHYECSSYGLVTDDSKGSWRSFQILELR